MQKNKFYTIALIIAIILLGILVYISFINKVDKKPTYHAVFLRTGDMYFGKLSRFPKLTLSDVWFIQRNVDEKQGGFNLMKYSNAMFGPEDKMEINKENVVWISKLRNDSQVVNYIQSTPQPTLPTLEE